MVPFTPITSMNKTIIALHQIVFSFWIFYIFD